MAVRELSTTTIDGVEFVFLYGKLHADTENAARYTGFSPGTLFNFVSSGRLARRRGGRFNYYPKVALDALGETMISESAA